MGERTVRRSLIIDDSSVVRQATVRGAPAGSRLERVLACKPRILVSVALANKMARVAWAVMTKTRITELRQQSRRKQGRRSEASGK